MRILKYGFKQKSNHPAKSKEDQRDSSSPADGLSNYPLTFWELDIAKTKLNKILNSSLDVICAVDEKGFFLYVSAACESVWGYKADELIGKRLLDFVYSEDQEKTRAEAVRVMEGKDRIHFENRYIRKDGTIVPITWSARWDEKDKIRYGVARNATEKKRGESRLRESENIYKNLFTNSPFPIYIWDLETLQLMDCNEEALLKYNYTKEEFLKLSITDLSCAEDFKLIDELIKVEGYGGIHKKAEQHRRKNGDLMYLDVCGHLINYNDRESFLVMVYDVTKGVEAEEVKEFDRINTEALINSTEDLIWSVNADFELIIGNKAFVQKIEEIAGINILPGDDLLRIKIFQGEQSIFWKECYSKVFLGEHLKKEVYSLSISNQKENWFDISFNPIYKNSSVVGVACYSKDITKRKLAEEQLKKSETRLIEAQGVAKIGSWETDLSTLNVSWSNETYKIFEVDPDFFSASHPTFLNYVHPDDRTKVDTAFADSFYSNAVNTIEHRIVTPAGLEKTVEECWRIFFDENRNPVRAMGTCRDITEKKIAEQCIRNSEEKRRLIMNAALDAIICIDSKGLITFWNPQAEVIFGWKENQVRNKSLSLTIIPEQYRSRHDEGMAHYLKTGDGSSLNTILELSAINRDCKEFPIELIITSIKQADGVFFCAFIRDITERKRTEKTLQAAFTEKNNILESIGDGFFALDKNWVVSYWNNQAERILGKFKRETIGKIFWNIYPELIDSPFATYYHKAVTENSIQHFEEYYSVLSAWYEVSVYPSDNGLSVYFKDVTERKKAEEKIKESNERYNIICKATNDMVWDWDLIKGTVYRNKEGWQKIFRTGYSDIQKGSITEWNERIHPEDLNKVSLIIKEIEKSEKDAFEVECRMRRDDDSYAYIHDRGYVLRNELGKAVRLIGATQDITARKEAELRVIKSELRFKSLVQNSSDLTSIVDKKGYYLYCSPAVKKILGYDPEMILGKNAFSFIHPDDIVVIKNYLSNPQKENINDAPLFRFKNAKGEWRWLETKVTNMSADPDIMGYIFNSRDVTERKVAEDEIEKLSIIAKETVNAVIISDAEGKILWVNEGFTQITEFESAEVLGKKPGDFLQGKETNPAIVRFMKQKIKSIKPFECDIINYSKYGRKYWLRIQCQPQFDDAGKLKYFFAIETDITKEKEAEEILKASEERYRYLFDNNPASIFIWDVETLQILEVNKTALNEYGYSREEFISKTILDYGNPKYIDKVKAFISEVRGNDNFNSVNISKHMHKSGKVMYLSIASHRIVFKGKSVIMALATNVTEKFLLEKLLAEEKEVKQKEITSAVISAQEQERQEIGRELHDNINQILAISRLYLGMAKNQSPITLSHLDETDNLITTAINEIRSLSHSMISPSLNESDLDEALTHLINSIRKSSGIDISLHVTNFNENIISDKFQLTIYRIVQEQFNNIIKYANASNVAVLLDQRKNKIILSIKDDGIGFDTTKKATGVGLMNIKTRASLFNGDMRVNSTPGNGCELVIAFKCK